MSYITFGILTNTPATVRNFLIARNIIEQVDDGEGGTTLVGVKLGLEWLEIPNTIVATAAVGVPGDPGYIPPVYNSMRLFIMKFAHEMRVDEEAGEPQYDVDGNLRSIFLRTKIGKWVQANSTAYTYTEPGTGGRTFTGRKVTGQQTWLIGVQSTAQIHAWQ